MLDSLFNLLKSAVTRSREPVSVKVERELAELDELSNAQIVELRRTAPKLKTILDWPDSLQPPFRMLTPNIICKSGYDVCSWEAQTMELVRSQTNIPVPRVLRFFSVEGDGHLVMEFIRGRLLRDCWSDLTLWQKLMITWTLRGYIRQLRRIRTPQIDAQVPGPYTEDLTKPIRCSGPLLGEYDAGPFASMAELAAWYNLAHQHAIHLNPHHRPALPFDDSEPLVLTHGDLTMRNLILGDDGKLWVIDWGASGVYPRWFEVCAMLTYSPPLSWKWASRFAAGWYRSQEVFFSVVYNSLSVLGGLTLPQTDPSVWELDPKDWKVFSFTPAENTLADT